MMVNISFLREKTTWLSDSHKHVNSIACLWLPCIMCCIHNTTQHNVLNCQTNKSYSDLHNTHTPNISLKIFFLAPDTSSRFDRGNRSNMQRWNKFNLKHLQQSTGTFSFYLCPPCSTPPTPSVLYHRKERNKCANVCEVKGGHLCSFWCVAQLSQCKTPNVHSGSEQDRATVGSLCLLKDVSPLICSS